MEERHRTLALTSAILFSFYYVYDVPAAMSKYLLGGQACRLALLYSAYALPNLVAPLVFGWTGAVRRPDTAIILCALVFIGQVVFTTGVATDSFAIMLAGRVIFGIGGESFTVLQNRLISRNFQGKELAFAMAFYINVARTGTITNFLVTPLLARISGSIAACCVGVFVSGMGLSLSIYSHQQIKNARIKPIEKRHKNEDNGYKDILKECKLELIIDCEYDNKNDVINTASLNSNTINNSLISQQPFVDSKITNETIRDNTPETNIDNTLFYNPPLKGPKAYHPAFIVLAITAFFLSAVWASFYNVAPLLLQARYSIGVVKSGRVMAILEGISIIASLLVSVFADLYGGKLIFIFIGGLLLIFSHIIILIRIGSHLLPICLLGLAGPLAACYWPCIPYLVSDETIGTGFAIISCVLNSAFLLAPIGVGALVRLDPTYTLVEFGMVIGSIMALGFIILLCYFNSFFLIGLNRKHYAINK
ncbi:Major facilitator superfamily domain-containing protein 1 [Astathelohania contejeani]|uniref:Lysosomal dipeptide transporter MFSD1 n=1 Tax=Astathelohania contejeani TaxID=164912 RepID=A0ABQ7I0U3_9MICR|nr:Major facilitator superfamily domain-containing protein 1 [Thelohania contejeani]